MKTNFVKKSALLIVFVALLMMGNSCKKQDKTISNPQVSFSQEYDELTTKEFHSLREARLATSDFLSTYYDEENDSECYKKVEQMEIEFAKMSDLFMNVENSAPKQRYSDFLSMVKSNDKVFSGSFFESVRSTWSYLVAEKKEAYMKERLDMVDEADLQSYLMTYAKDLAMDWYGGQNWVVVDKECYIENGELEDLYMVDGKVAKRGTCVVYVKMEGKWHKNKKGENRRFDVGREGAVEIWVEGTVTLSESGRVVFSRGGKKEMEVYGGLVRAKRIRENGIKGII